MTTRLIVTRGAPGKEKVLVVSGHRDVGGTTVLTAFAEYQGTPTEVSTWLATNVDKYKEHPFVAEAGTLDTPQPPAEIRYCPYCAATQIRESNEWFAHSLDTCDLHNTAELTEYQCERCCRSFWA